MNYIKNIYFLASRLKTSTYHAYVPIARAAAQVSAFCREVCVKLQACPSLFGPDEYIEQCPNDCQHVDKSTFRKFIIIALSGLCLDIYNYLFIF